MDHELTTGADDATLAQAWVAGDEGGYTILVNRYASMVYNRCRRALGVVDADDATQAVFLVLARKRSQAAASPALAAWLLTVADFVIRNARRDRGRLRQVVTPDLLSALPAPEPTMSDIREHLDACLAQLPTAEREAVRLHHLAGHTLAEVAAHTGVPLSTVHDRVRRGLERMKSLLVRRGVQAVSITILLACLQAEAAGTTVPSGLMAHLRDLTPAGGGTGATAAPSDRAVRWSQPRMSTMTRIAIAGAAALLLGSATAPFLLTASEATPAPTATPAAPPKPEFDLDPERAHEWMTMRWIDGARTAERLRTLPEMALLAERAPSVLEMVAGLRQAALVVRPGDIVPREQMVKHYALQREVLCLPSEQQGQRMVAAYEEQRRMVENRAADGIEASPPHQFIACCEGWFTFASPEAQLPFAGILDQGIYGLLSTVPAPDGWNLGHGGAARVVRDGNRLNLHGMLAPLVPDPLGGHWTSSDADLEIVDWLDTGVPGTSPVRNNMASVTVTADGLHLTTASYWVTTQHRQVAESWPRLDFARLDEVPAQAILACAVPMTCKNTARSAFMQVLLSSLTRPLLPGKRSGVSVEVNPHGMAVSVSGSVTTTGEHASSEVIVKALQHAIPLIDGTIVAWVEPGAPLPTITVEADMPQAAADALIAAIAVPRAADGSITIFTDMVSVNLGWHNGRLICTTVPGGLAAIDRRGGFSRQPEVQRAIAAMPSKQPNMCVVLRPAALVETVAPYVAIAGPDWATRLEEYEQRLRQSSAYGFFTVVGDANGVRMDAAGLLSLVAGSVLGSFAQSPMSIAN